MNEKNFEKKKHENYNKHIAVYLFTKFKSI